MADPNSFNNGNMPSHKPNIFEKMYLNPLFGESSNSAITYQGPERVSLDQMPQPVNAAYLDSFNIDLDSEQNEEPPHYIVNLDAYTLSAAVNPEALTSATLVTAVPLVVPADQILVNTGGSIVMPSTPIVVTTTPLVVSAASSVIVPTTTPALVTTTPTAVVIEQPRSAGPTLLATISAPRSASSGPALLATISAPRLGPAQSTSHPEPRRIYPATTVAAPATPEAMQNSPPRGRGRGRGRGRPSSNPPPPVHGGDSASQVLNMKVRVFEGAQLPNKVKELQAMFPHISRIVIDRTYTNHLFNLEKTIEELRVKQEAEEEKRRNVRLVPRSKPDNKEINKSLPNRSLNLTADRLGRGVELYRRVVVMDGEIVTAPPKVSVDVGDEEVCRFMQRHCRTYVSNQVDGTLMEDVRGITMRHRDVYFGGSTSPPPDDAELQYAGASYAANTTVKPFKPTVATPTPDATAASTSSSSAADGPRLPGIAAFLATNSVRGGSSSASATALAGDADEQADIKEDIEEEVDISDSNMVVDLNPLVIDSGEAQSSSCPDNGGNPLTPSGVGPAGNRFFRTKRLCETELKKREYVSRELHHGAGRGWLTARATGGSSPMTGLGPGASSGVQQPRRRRAGGNGSPRGSSGKRQRTSVSGTGASAGTPGNGSSSEGEDGDQKQLSVIDVVKIEQPDDNLQVTMDERNTLLTFFNESPIEELALMPGCSRKKAELIIHLRPFSDTSDLVTRLDHTRPLSSALVHGCKEILHMRSLVVRLLQRCEKISDKISQRAGPLLGPSQIELDAAGLEREGEAVLGQPALINSSLLLKPYQLVGLNWLRLLHTEQLNGILADEMGLGKTVQTIAFLTHLLESGDKGPHLIIVPSSTLDNWRRELATWCPAIKVLVYYGSLEERKAVRVRIYEGVNADFNVMLTTYTVATSAIEDRAMMKRVSFHYGVFDEAHMLKNMTSQRYRNLMNFKVQRRLLLTGTPLQNNLMELISLLAFVMPDMFMRNTELLKRMFQIYSKSSSGGDAVEDESGCRERTLFEIEKIQQAKNLLRPFCLRRLKSQVLAQLPPKTEDVIRVSMPEPQRSVYWELVEQMRVSSKAYLLESGVNTSANTTGGGSGEGGTNKNEVGFVGVAGAPVTEGVDLLLQAAAAADSVASTSTPVPTPAINGGNGTGSSNSTTAINLITQLRKASNHPLLHRRLYTDELLREMAKVMLADPDHSRADPQLIFEDMACMNDFQLHKTCLFYKVLEKYTLAPEAITNSAKMQYLDKQLPQLLAAGDRVLIFSQFVLMLDILEEYMGMREYSCLRLDGQTPVPERQMIIDEFNRDEEIKVCLLSTRAGGLGINLTGANVVVLHDIDFNPYNDRQAEDRCHRVGQTRPVRVIRLITERTIEEGMLRIATDKLQLEAGVTVSEQQPRRKQPQTNNSNKRHRRGKQAQQQRPKALRSPTNHGGGEDGDEVDEEDDDEEQQETVIRGGAEGSFMPLDSEVKALLSEALRSQQSRSDLK